MTRPVWDVAITGERGVPSMPPSPTIGRGGLIGLLVLGVVLTWLVVSRSGAAYLASSSPEFALRLNSHEPDALVALAQATLLEAISTKRSPDAAAGQRVDAGDAQHQSALAPGTPAADKIAALASRAIVAAPLDARALRLLAELSDAAGDKSRKYALLQAAVLRTKHDPSVSLWLMLEAIERNEHARTVYYADIVLTKHPQLGKYVMPALVAMAESKTGDVELKQRLAANPVWRERFFDALPPLLTNARMPLDLLVTLKGTDAPPTAGEVRAYIDFLITKHLYELAYHVWLQFLPPEALTRVALINNGSFERAPAGTPFDWILPPGTGVTLELRNPPGEVGRALFVEFIGQGRVELQPVRQLLVLSPGTYRLTAKLKGEVIGRRGLQWTISCAETNQQIGESPMFVGTIPAWKALQAEFVVPPEGCRAQYVRLILASRSASEQLVKGHAWYDEFQIVRAEK